MQARFILNKYVHNNYTLRYRLLAIFWLVKNLQFKNFSYIARSEVGNHNDVHNYKCPKDVFSLGRSHFSDNQHLSGAQNLWLCLSSLRAQIQ